MTTYIKSMKMNYEAPATTVIVVKIEAALLQGSPNQTRRVDYESQEW